MTHIAFVAISYAVTALTIFALIGWIFLDQRARQAELKQLEAQGVRRRSQRPQGGAGDEH